MAPITSTRRTFLHAVAASPMLLASARTEARRPIKVAAILTEFTYRSHAHVILENFLNPYLFNGQVVHPNVEVVSLYVDQFPEAEMARQVARERKIPIFPSIAEALRVGQKQLAVDAVLSIGEHGRYPMTDRWQTMYPRKRFFDAIAAVIEADGRPVPVFNDKHLSYRWDWADQMARDARRLRIPFMAGSSVPLSQRRPALEVPRDADIVEAVSIHGGGVESYDFHALEVLQAVVEARRGGEAGVRQVRFLEGPALWKAAEEGLWSVDLALAAMRAELGDPLPSFKELLADPRIGSQPPHAIVVETSDGKRFAALKVGSSGVRWNVAYRLRGNAEPAAWSHDVGPWQNRNLFKALSHAIQGFFASGQAPYPVERTLLVSGVLAAAMDSRWTKAPVKTPHLEFGYEPRDFRVWRETGATWKIITDAVPEPKGLDTAQHYLKSAS